MKSKIVVLCLILALLCSACTATKVGDFRRLSFLQTIELQHLAVKARDGSEITLDGYKNDGGAEAFARAADMLQAASELLRTIRPTP